MCHHIKRNLPTLITIIVLIGMMGLIGLIGTSFSPKYVVRLISITSGISPKAELEINARKEGDVNIIIELFRKGNLAASGKYHLNMLAKQVEEVVVPLSIKHGHTNIFGKTASYTSIKITINSKKINWKWKK